MHIAARPISRAQRIHAMDNFRLAALTALWYAASLLFNLGMKRSHALIPDVLVLTTLQFCVGAVALV